ARGSGCGGGAHEVHAAGIAVKAIANHRDVDIDDVAGLQLPLARYSVANHVVYRGANSLRKAPVVEIGRDGLQFLHNVVVAALVELVGGDSRLNERFDHVEDTGRQ